jgi:hypothetical protein
MKLFVGILMFSIAAMAGDNPFELYMGCYDTVTLNGKPIPTSDESKSMGTTIKLDNSVYYANKDGSAIPSISFDFYRGVVNGVHYFDTHDAFLDRGETVKHKDSVEFNYSGEVNNFFQPEIVWKLTSRIALAPDDDIGHIWVHATRKIEGYTDGETNVSDIYELRSKPCE